MIYFHLDPDSIPSPGLKALGNPRVPPLTGLESPRFSPPSRLRFGGGPSDRQAPAGARRCTRYFDDAKRLRLYRASRWFAATVVA